MENLLKPEIVSALGWTLVHSIWQGIVLAILYFVLSKFLKSAQTKYQIGVGALLAQFALAVGTFYYVVDFNKEVFTNGVSENVLQYFSNIKNVPSNLSIIDSTQLFLNTNLSLIVQVWVIGVSIFFLKLTLDIWMVNRLKIKGLQEVDAITKSKFNNLVERLGITQEIQIFESNQTQSPIVIGNLKPYILLPIGLLSGLTINELEAILAHELAHIKRYDFLVNILQSIIEIAFFFNPAIWWISSQIREEREHCCDDFSVSITGDKMLLVNALAQVESFRVNQPLAMAFGKKKMTLLSRIKRILGVNQPQNQSIESVMIMVLVSVICGGLLIFKSDEVAAKANIIAQKVESLYAKNEVIGTAKEPTKPKEVLENQPQFPALKIDTTITEIEQDTQDTHLYLSNRITDNDGKPYKYFNSNSKRGSFWIDQNGEIYVNGKKYNASPELLAKIKPYLKKMDVLSAEMDIYGKKMGEFGDEMNVYGTKMNDKNAPMAEFGRLMEAQGKLLEENIKLQTKFSLKASLAEIDNDKANQEANRKLEKEHEKRVDAISKEMERLGKEMEKIGKEMENDGKPMEAIGKKMEAEGAKMEVIGKKMELVAKDLVNLLPADLKAKIKDIEKGFKE